MTTNLEGITEVRGITPVKLDYQEAVDLKEEDMTVLLRKPNLSRLEEKYSCAYLVNDEVYVYIFKNSEGNIRIELSDSDPTAKIFAIKSEIFLNGVKF